MAWRARPIGALLLAASTVLTGVTASAAAVGSSPDEWVDPIGRARLLVPDAYLARTPAVSKNARFVAYLEAISRGGSSWHNVFRFDRRTGEKRLVSRGIDGVQQRFHSESPDISWDGRYVVFSSEASNLVADDTNGDIDVFLYDALEDHTILISRAETGELGQSDSELPRISRDGRFVTFIGGLGLDPEDTNSYEDAFVYEINTGELEVISTAHDGAPSDRGAQATSISGDGRFVAFTSSSTDLLEEPDEGTWSDVFLHDRQTGVTSLVSHAPDGAPADRSSFTPSISRTGRMIAFDSEAGNLAPDNGEGTADVYLYDARTDTIELASPSLDTEGHEGGSYAAEISGNGRFVTFTSAANDLVPYDIHYLRNVFLYDSSYDSVYVVSHGQDGEPTDGSLGSSGSAIGASARFVVFGSDGSNVADGDEDPYQDLFFYRITRVGLRTPAG